jgi:catechol 2,3-dioxygenase-like lactoylglutathione lyase family enzyme
MVKTRGINHPGLSVKNLDQSVSFFADCLGWEETGRDVQRTRWNTHRIYLAGCLKTRRVTKVRPRPSDP